MKPWWWCLLSPRLSQVSAGIPSPPLYSLSDSARMLAPMPIFSSNTIIGLLWECSNEKVYISVVNIGLWFYNLEIAIESWWIWQFHADSLSWMCSLKELQRLLRRADFSPKASQIPCGLWTMGLDQVHENGSPPESSSCTTDERDDIFPFNKQNNKSLSLEWNGNEEATDLLEEHMWHISS